MVKKTVYIVAPDTKFLFIKKGYKFKRNIGVSAFREQKYLNRLKDKFKKEYKDKKLLEISSQSEKYEGRMLCSSNFTMKEHKSGKSCMVEALFNGCKKFQDGGPYKDLFYKSMMEIKKDKRLRRSGKLVCYEYNNHVWELEPETHFYD